MKGDRVQDLASPWRKIRMEEKEIKILIVDAHPLFRRGVRLYRDDRSQTRREAEREFPLPFSNGKRWTRFCRLNAVRRDRNDPADRGARFRGEGVNPTSSAVGTVYNALKPAPPTVSKTPSPRNWWRRSDVPGAVPSAGGRRVLRHARRKRTGAGERQAGTLGAGKEVLALIARGLGTADRGAARW